MAFIFSPLVSVLPAPNADGILLHLVLPNRTSFAVHVPRSSLPLEEIMRQSPLNMRNSPQLPTSENNTNSDVVPSNAIVPFNSSSQTLSPTSSLPELPAPQTTTTNSIPALTSTANTSTPQQPSANRRLPLSFLLRLPFSTIRTALGQNQSTITTSEETQTPSQEQQQTDSSEGFLYLQLDGLTNSFEETDISDILNQLMQLHEPRGPPPASKSALDSLKEIPLTSQMVQEHKRCSVCCEDFEEGKQVLQLPCNHLFDRECVETWLKQHNTCPICRYELPVDDEEYEKKRKERMANRPQYSTQSNVPENAVPMPMETSQLPTQQTAPTTSSPMESETPVPKQKAEAKKKPELGLKKGFLLKKEGKSKPKKDEFLSGLKRGFLSENKSNNKRTRL